MDDGSKAPSTWAPAKGLSKSNSTASAGGGSIKSHHSVSVLGSHALGSLQVHSPDEAGSGGATSPLRDANANGEENDDEPPPLDPPTGQAGRAGQARQLPLRPSPYDQPRSLTGGVAQQGLTHGMGGGDVALVLDLPEVFTVGYDSVSFTAKHFGGVRDIPKGPHLFWVAHPGGLSTRSGFWLYANGVDTVHVMQWDRFNEVLGQSARAEARIQADNLEAIHSKLVPYADPSAVNTAKGELSEQASERNMKMWEQLTGSITDKTLGRIMGQSPDNWTVHTGDRVKGSILMAGEMELDNSLSHPVLQERELNFVFSQSSKTYSTSHTGSDRTLEATDATSYVTSLIDASDNDLTDEDIVGEFQFAYVVGMHLGNDACIHQWWHILLKIILRAYALPARRPSLAAALLRTLTAQLSYSTSWLDGSVLEYTDSLTGNMRLALTIYKRRIDELLLGLGAQASPDQLAVGTAFAGLEAAIAALGWDIRGEYLRRGNVMMEDGEEVELEVTDLAAEDERGEWAPEVVQLDESGRQRDLVSWND